MFVAIECMSDDYKKTVFVYETVLDDWRSVRQNRREKTEAFGVLIGAQNQDASQFWVEACTKPLGKDFSTRTSFILKDPHHQQCVDRHFKESEGSLGYLGTWHSHPESIPSPSHVDLKDWHSCCERNPDRKLIFVIVGTSHFCIYHRTATEFKCICKELL
ncbi:MAG: hypothetical protein CMF12_00690 [Idiomarina sp.]|uniref:Mov34/MPN/PAD-1 family protein n=1 Tax=Idiomarina sp. TaxID=1874361 RepID=UPI000C3DE2EE|nr:Mov34/MPN/PAD-1 family protein [Idiomarina sp.]MBT41019.1 hypothetical protein [Idiomarina sp.]